MFYETRKKAIENRKRFELTVKTKRTKVIYLDNGDIEFKRETGYTNVLNLNYNWKTGK